jgi:hypothetical protein
MATPLTKMNDDALKMLLHGRSGTGKSSFGSTIAQSCKTLYIDLPGEKGIKSIKNASYANNIMVERPQSVTEISQLFWDTQTGQVDCQAVMLESISALQKMYVRYLLGVSEDSVQEVTQNPKGLDMQGWGKVLSFMTDQIVFWYNLADSERDNPIHIIMTSQSKTVEDEDTGETEVSPDVSKGSRAIVEASPDYIGYCFVEEGESESLTEEKWNFCVRFGPHDMIRTKVREDADSSKKLPYVLGRKSRPTVPKLAKRLGIPLT